MEKAYRSGYDFSAVKGAKDISTAPSSKGIFIAAMDQAKVYADKTVNIKKRILRLPARMKRRSAKVA